MRFVFVVFFVLFLTSCADGVTETIRYKTSSATPTLVVPPDLTDLDEKDNFAIPSSDIGTNKAKGKFKETGKYIDKVLPKLDGFELVGDAGFYWLEVQQPPEKVYSLIKQFWLDEGFTLLKDEPLIGLMQTNWLENKAGTLDSSSNLLNRLLSIFSSNDEKDQYTTRIERDGDSATKVFLSEKGIEYIITDEDAVTGSKKGWQNRPHDPNLEAEMMSRLMLYMGMQDTAIRAQLAKLGQLPPRAKLMTNSDGETKLIVKESIGRAWNRLLISLDRLGATIAKKDRLDGLLNIKLKPITEEQAKKGIDSALYINEAEHQNETLIDLNIGLEKTTTGSTEISVILPENAKDKNKTAAALYQYLYKSLK